MTSASSAEATALITETSGHSASPRSPGGHPEVFLDEVAGDGQRQEGDEEDRGHVGNDAQGGDAQQGGAAEALQRGGDVLVDGVGVRGEPVEDAAERSRLEQPGGKKQQVDSVMTLRNQARL